MMRFASTRTTEVLILQGSSVLGAVLGSAGHDGLALGRIALVVSGSLLLTAHVYLFNDWAGQSSDLLDPRRARNVFGSREISSREVARLVVGLLVVAMLFLALVSASALLCGGAIAVLSFVYSGSASWGKGKPIVGSILHLIGGAFHFLLGYSASHAIDGRGVAIAIFFGLVFAGGHMNQEVRDYEADVRSQIRTNAVAFGCRRTFIYSLLVFTAAYLVLGLLVGFGILARPLIWATLLWPWHLASSMEALRHGLGFEAAVSMQRRYRLQFALLGLAMLLTATPVVEFARRAHTHATTTRFAAQLD